MISAIILAAGASSRMGEPKPLVALGDRTVLGHVLDAVTASRVGETIVVLGADADRVRAGVDLAGTRTVENPAFTDGMSTSLRAGLAALAPGSEAFFVVLGDEPFVTPGTLDQMIAARDRTHARVVVPVYRGVRGNPVLIDRSLAQEAEEITGDRGCRAIRLHHPEETVDVPVDDPGVVIDLDTPEEVQRARTALANGEDLADVAKELVRPRPGRDLAAPPPRLRGRPDVWGLAAELERRREPYCLAVVTRVVAPTSGKPGFKALIREDGTIVGWVGGSCSRQALLAEARRALEDGLPRVLRLRPDSEACPPASPGVVDRVMECQSGGSMDIYVEPHGPTPQLVVIGDSPVAEALAGLGRLVGYRVVVAGLGLDPTRFPDADELVDDLGALPARLDRESYGVVATMALYDAKGLEALVRSPAPYVALVASRRRAGYLFDDLRGRGISEDTVRRIRNPAGLDLGAKTPEEIAVSIIAEIVRVRRTSAVAPAAADASVTPPANVAVDPVCHMEVDPASTPLRSVHAGTTYYFCSEGCVRRFEANPAEFLG